MIEKLSQSSGGVIGFKVSGHVRLEEYEPIEQQLRFLIQSRRKKPIGILVDLSELESVDIKARWAEMRFLQKHDLHIARMAVVGAHPWEHVTSLFVVAAALLQAETLYFHLAEMHAAWSWVRTSKHAMDPPPPRISAADSVWKDYVPEYMDV